MPLPNLVVVFQDSHKEEEAVDVFNQAWYTLVKISKKLSRTCGIDTDDKEKPFFHYHVVATETKV